MIAALVVLVALIVAYLVGSIPFGFLVARGFAGVDIRTLGSGNIGATNVGRVLGFRFFWLVFALDYVKGLLPTYYFASLAERISGANLPDLPVGVAVATILGHNFPVYLRFKGGKGRRSSAASSGSPSTSPGSTTPGLGTRSP
jgi:glycerol-3-phosphate acyltransferase PlsY